MHAYGMHSRYIIVMNAEISVGKAYLNGDGHIPGGWERLNDAHHAFSRFFLVVVVVIVFCSAFIVLSLPPRALMECHLSKFRMCFEIEIAKNKTIQTQSLRWLWNL